MKIAIFCTSNDTSEFASRFITDDVKYVNLLQPLRPDWQFDCFAVWQDEFPQDIDIYDGIIMTGSPASVHDDEPWIAKLLDLIREMHARKIRMFGGCFGHQAIAKALGGKVEKNRKGGWSIGKETTRFTEQPEFLHGLKPDIELYSIHKEEVTELPEGAKRIGTNAYCENPALVIGDHVFSSQYHPEMTSDFLTALTHEMRGDFDDEVLDAARAAFEAPHEGTEFAKALVRFFEA